MRKLDESRPKNRIYGDEAFGRVWEQDGVEFDGAGNEVIITQAMRAKRVAQEAEAAAASGDDDKAAVAQVLRVNARLEQELEDLKKKLSDLETAKAKPAKAEQKPAPTTAVDDQLSKQ